MLISSFSYEFKGLVVDFYDVQGVGREQVQVDDAGLLADGLAEDDPAEHVGDDDGAVLAGTPDIELVSGNVAFGFFHDARRATETDDVRLGEAAHGGVGLVL